MGEQKEGHKMHFCRTVLDSLFQVGFEGKLVDSLSNSNNDKGITSGGQQEYYTRAPTRHEPSRTSPASLCCVNIAAEASIRQWSYIAFHPSPRPPRPFFHWLFERVNQRPKAEREQDLVGFVARSITLLVENCFYLGNLKSSMFKSLMRFLRNSR